MSFNAREKIDSIISGVDPSWSNLKKARYITIKLCEMYKYNPTYNYGDQETKTSIYNQVFMSRSKYLKSGTATLDRDITYLDLEEQNKICVELAQIYTYMLSMVGVEYEDSWVSEIFIYYENGKKEGFLQKIVEDLYTVKTKKTPEGFFVGESQGSKDYEDKMEYLKKIDAELGYIDKSGYTGDAIPQDEPDISLETTLNGVSNYLNKVLGTEISEVELHKYYKYILKTIFPGKKVYVIPFSGEDYKDIQYLIESKMDDTCEFFFYDEVNKRFKRATSLEIKEKIKDKEILTQNSARKEELLDDLTK